MTGHSPVSAPHFAADQRRIRGVRLRDANEAVHDAPDGPEQADERRGGADRRQEVPREILRPAIARQCAPSTHLGASWRRSGSRLRQLA